MAQQRHSNGTAPHGTAEYRTARQGTVPHGNARRCSAELVLRCATELSSPQPGPGIMIFVNKAEKEKPSFNMQNTAFFWWERSKKLCFRHLSPLSGPESRMS